MTGSHDFNTDARDFGFVDENGARVNSTDFAKSVLARATKAVDFALAKAIAAEGGWRKNYQRYFNEIARLEFEDKNKGFDLASTALAGLGAQIVDQEGNSLNSLATSGFSKTNMVQTFRIKGASSPQPHWPSWLGDSTALASVAERWVETGLAEPDVAKAFNFLAANPNLPISNDLLIALAGNAELAATRDWLSLGGRVAVVARPNQDAWMSLIAHARASAGELLICVDARHELSSSASDREIAAAAGLNLVDNIDVAASWIHELSRSENRIVMASYSYVGGSKQIIAQAAQDAIIEVASANIARAKLALAYLATPLDVVVAPNELAAKQLAAYDIRTFGEKLRDAFFAIFGQLKPATPILSANNNFAIFDASSVRQGSSYLLAKHSEKWRALVSARRGNLVSFTVAPPARTRSVLGTTILEKTYRGLPIFGVEPFDSAETRRAMTLLMLRNLHDAQSPAAPANSLGAPVAMVSATAIHGGIWRLGYKPDTVWVAATVLGALTKKTRRILH